MNSDNRDTKEEILEKMRMSMFVALADETPDPSVSEVDEPYNDVKGETPDGETATGDINRKTFGKSRIYVDSPEAVPEGFEIQEGQQGGLYYETDGATEEFTQEEWEQAGLQILEDFDEDDYRFDYWEHAEGDDIQPGSIVHISDEMFSTTADTDGPQGVIVDTDPEAGKYAVVTEDGEMVLAEDFDSLVSGEAESGVTAVWDSPDQDNIRTGWDQSQANAETEDDEEKVPHWADEEPLEGLEGSQAPEDGLQAGELYSYNDDIYEAEPVETEGEVDVYEIGGNEFSTPDGVLSEADTKGVFVQSDGLHYIEFEDGFRLEDGWYQIGDYDPEEESFEVYGPNGTGELGVLEVESRDSATQVIHTPVEHKTNISDVDSLSEPSGDPDPDTWNVNWDATVDADDAKPRLNTAEKKKLMREWKAAVGEEAAENVRSTIRSVKDDTYNTDGQKYDKLIQAAMGVGGEPRSGDFEDAADPTEEEIEAMRVLQDASQKFFEDKFGESSEISRALADFSHERTLPAISEVFENAGTLEGQSFELQDNPASVWTTDETGSRSFTIIGEGTSTKSLVVNEQISSEEVFNMPDALVPYEEREEVSGDDSDWNEGEVNVPGSNRVIEMGDVEVVGAGPDDMHQVPITDAYESPKQVLEQGDGPALEQFVETLSEYAPENFRNQYYERLRNDEEFREMDGSESILEAIEYYGGMERSVKQDSRPEGERPVVDIRSEEDANWLNTVDAHMREKAKTDEITAALMNTTTAFLKGRRYIDDPSEAPDWAEVQEGPQGGLFFETTETNEEQSQLDDYSGGSDTEEESNPVDDIPDFYEADFNEYVQSFIKDEKISLTVPDNPDMDDLREAKNDWERSKDALKEFMDEGAEAEEAMEVVTFAANRRDEIRRRRNNSGGGSNAPEPPEEPDPISTEELEEWDGEVPEEVPEELNPVYAIADMSDSYKQFRESITQDGLFDISNRKIHRFGRAFSGDPDYEMWDLENMSEAEINQLADSDPETVRRIQDARNGDGTITMFRAVPEFVDDIGTGDYVALNPEYVQRHGENVLGGQQGKTWDILEEEVPIEDVAWPGEVADEFVYSPKEYREQWPSTKHFYEDVKGEDTKSKILNTLSTKARRYIDDPSEAPEGVDVEEGPNGGLYYETGSTESDESEDHENAESDEPDDAELSSEQQQFAESQPQIVNMIQHLNAKFGPKITQSFMRNAAKVTDHIDGEVVADAAALFLSDGDVPDTPIGLEKATEGMYLAKDAQLIAPRMKARRYVNSPEEVPDGFEVQEGPQGGLFYETGSDNSVTGNEGLSNEDWKAPPEDNADLIEGQSVLIEADGDFFEGEVAATADNGLVYVNIEDYGRMRIRPNQDIKEIVAVGDEPGTNESDEADEADRSGELSVDETVEEMKEVSVLPENQIARGAELLQEGKVTPEDFALATAQMGIDRMGHAKELAQESTFTNHMDMEVGYQLEKFIEEKQQIQERFGEEYGGDAKMNMMQMSDSWIGPMFVPATAGLFQYAAEQTDNATAPAKRNNGPFDTEARESRLEAAQKAHEYTQEVLRETFGDTVTVFRGIAPEGGLDLGAQQEGEDEKIAQMREAVENGADVEKENRTLESWTTSVEYASRYAKDNGGMIFRREVPVEKVLMSSHSGFLSAGENEMVVMDEETVTYDNEDVIIPDHLSDQDFMEIQAEAIYDASQSGEEEEEEKMSKDVFRLPVESDNPHWLHQLDTDDEESTAEKSNEEVLEIKDYYRVWVKSPEGVPEEQTVLYDKEGDPDGNHYYYEVPFQTKTRIDIDGDVNKELTKAMYSKSRKEYPERVDLVDIGVPDKDLTLVDKARTQIENDMPLFGKDIRKSNPSILKDVESALTLLHLYKILYDKGGEYEAFMNQIQKELGHRGIYSFEKVSKARRYINSPDE